MGSELFNAFLHHLRHELGLEVRLVGFGASSGGTVHSASYDQYEFFVRRPGKYDELTLRVDGLNVTIRQPQFDGDYECDEEHWEPPQVDLMPVTFDLRDPDSLRRIEDMLELWL
jgi:hypothetical protein